MTCSTEAIIVGGSICEEYRVGGGGGIKVSIIAQENYIQDDYEAEFGSFRI